MTRIRTTVRRVEATVVGVLMIMVLVTMLFQLAACSPAPSVSADDRAAAQEFLRADQAPMAVHPIGLWYASGEVGGMMCGEIEAPAALKSRRSSLRYIFDRRTGVHQVEMHEMWTSRSPVSRALIETNRGEFDDMWAKFCQPYAPLAIRAKQWLHI